MPESLLPKNDPALADTIAGLLRTRLAAKPRLLLSADAEAKLKRRLETDTRMQGLRRLLLADADTYRGRPAVERVLEGRRLLGVSREVLLRVLTFALAYRLTGDAKHLAAARDVMMTVANFSDWNPSHFLDVAEMTTAVAIGYDWLQKDLPDADRNVLRLAIREKGIEPSYATEQFWVAGENNWNQVCHTGMVLGSLAIADHEPELCVKTITRAVRNVGRAMASYAPDGAYPEGPMYWGYGTTFNVILSAALTSALGTDFGLVDEPGFLKSAEYYLHCTGPTGRFFNYGDCAEREPLPSPAFFWMADRLGEPALLLQQVRRLDAMIDPVHPAKRTEPDRLGALLMVWAGAFPDGQTPPTTSYTGRGPTPVALRRTDWTPAATYVGIKGGSPNVSHSHMDVGSFVVDHDGERWASDLGMQDYFSLESAGVNIWDGKPGGQRWDAFRIGSMSHGILTFDGKPQSVPARAEIVRSTDDSATVDCSAMYAGHIASHVRTLRLVKAGVVRVEDEVRTLAGKGTQMRWAMVTRAAVEEQPDGTLLLSQNGKRMRLAATTPAGQRLTVLVRDPRPHPYDAPNPGVSIVGFEADLAAGSTTNSLIAFDAV